MNENNFDQHQGPVSMDIDIFFATSNVSSPIEYDPIVRNVSQNQENVTSPLLSTNFGASQEDPSFAIAEH
jgi:hypothetical protein